MAFRLSTGSYLSVSEVYVESLIPSSASFIHYLYPGQNLAYFGGRL